MAKKEAATVERQEYLSDEMAPPVIPEIDEAGVAYKTKIKERLALQAEEAELKARLIELMHVHGLESYAIPKTNWEVALVYKDETVKVRERTD